MLLHETERTRITRIIGPAGSVIRKEPLGPDAAARLHHEADILDRLSGLAGVAQLAPDERAGADAAQPSPGGLLLDDVGGTALSERMVPWDPAALVALAESLAGALAGMHRRGVVHRDVNPANIILTDDQGAPCLIDFALAAVVEAAQVRSAPPIFSGQHEIVGTVPYLAPELTGRTGHPVDQRADLYALGATLYELATGSPPFGCGDPVRVIHDHLARVPTPPSVLNPLVSAELSGMLMHLLEKEPDDRYQSADGLALDLAELRRGGRVARPGGRDVPARPLTPSRLIGRDEEISDLRAAFADVMAGRCSGVLLSGVPGVGKTSLAAELRPIVAARGGWFVSGKFDQYRRDQEYDGVRQAFRELSRILLAEPEASLTEIRDRVLARLGAAAGLAVAVVPELGMLLRVRPDPGDPMTTQARAERCALEVLRAVACPDRPLVFFVDDLQWAGRTPLGLVDQIFSCVETIEGLLLVCAYREDAVDAAHPLTALLGTWGTQRITPRRLRLGGLSPAGQAAMLADLLNLPPASAVELAGLVVTATRGNPYDTVELINAMRHDGVLRADDGSWRWDRAALDRRRAQRLDIDALLTAHLATMPAATRELLVAMACLAGQVELELLAVAVGLSPDDVRGRLAAALAGGLVTSVVDDRESVRFYHDRVRESVLRGVTTTTRRDTELALARRLAGRSEFVAAAAQQYLRAADLVRTADERRRMGEIFRQAAVEAMVLADYALAERFLTAAVALVDPSDLGTSIELRTERHAALYCQGRLTEADEEFQAICQLSDRPGQRSAATAVQVMSLTNRSRGAEAISLGLDQLRRLGVAVPDRSRLDDEIDRGITEVARWFDETDGTDDVRRAGPYDDERRDAVGIVNRLMPAAYFADQPIMAWMSVNVLRMWAQDGRDPSLIGPAAHIGIALITRRGDYATARRMMRRILDVPRGPGDDAEGWEAQLWDARFLYVVSTGHWFDALEDNVAEARRVLAGLTRVGHLQNACWTHFVLLYDLLDCAPSLDEFVTEVDESLAIAARTGNPHAEETFQSCRRLARVLRGEAAESAVDLRIRMNLLADNPHAIAHLHVTQAIAAAILDQPVELARHTAAALAFSATIGANYSLAIARVLRALALAARARATAAGERDAALAELAELVAWVSARAADAPANFRHLLRLVEAERAWAAGDFQQAAYTFDLAQRDCQARSRPWHHALILERSARFYLAHGMYEAGRSLLAGARRRYGQWGATAKVSQLDWVNPTLCPEQGGTALVPGDGEDAGRRSTLTAGTIDLLGVVAASQALSSETSIAGLRARVEGILSEMTGATGVHLLLRDEDRRRWSVPDGTGAVVSLEAAGRRGLVPSSVVRYAERTHEPVAVADATQDDRFRRDPYFAGLDRCSLLAVPILIRGELRAMLLLENRMIRGAFSTERLEGIMLIAGQLAVSLDNALVYVSLEGKVADRTQQLAAANQRLEQLSVTDPLTGLANRRRLEEVLGSEWTRCAQQHTPLALAMIDIDHFKDYNDHFGHVAGDRCLQRVAACLAGTIGDTQLASRYGGEEFAIVLPDADRENAAGLAQRLCDAVVELAEPHPLARQRIVTVSVGVASVVPPAGGTVAALVDLADLALYQAKRDGRARVTVAAT